MSVDLEMLCNRLLGALFNGGYQGLVLTAAVWLGLRIVPRANAATRHMVWLVTFLLVAVLPAVHFLSLTPGELAPSQPGDSAGMNPSLAIGNVVEHGLNSSVASAEASGGDLPESWAGILPEGFAGYSLDSLLQISEQDVTHENASAIGSENSRRFKPPMALGADPGRTIDSASWWPAPAWNWRLSLPGRLGVVLIGLWAVLSSFRLGGLAWQCCRLQALKRRGASVPEGIHRLFTALNEEIGLRRKTHLMLCQEIIAPVAVGFHRPAVLLPAKMFDGAAELQLEQVLRHELAHVGRGDDWMNLIQQGIKALLFFHPAIWWLSRRLTLEREIACDDHVLAATRSPRAYALFLTEFASRRQCRALAAAPAAWSNKNQLRERITMILDSNRNASPRPARARIGILTAAAAMVAILGLHAGPRLVLAEDTIDSKTDTTVRHEIDVVTDVSVETNIELETAQVAAPFAAADESRAPSSDPIESGPRPKPQPVPRTPQALELPPASPLAPVPPHGLVKVHPPGLAGPAVVAISPGGPMVVAAPPVQPVPAVKVAARARNSGDDSLERRLERLEQLVESLLAREKGPRKTAEAEHDFKFEFKGKEFDLDKEKFAKLAEEHKKLAEKMHKFGPSEEELARIKDQAKRDAERAVRDVERAARDVERSVRESQDRVRIEGRRAQEAQGPQAFGLDTFEKQRQQFEAQRRALERQMEALQRQIERLEQEQEKLEPKRLDREKKPKPLEKDNDFPKPGDARGEIKPKLAK